MTQDEIIRMAQQCGDWNGETAEFNDVGLKRFAALVAAHEREKVAKLIEEIRNEGDDHKDYEGYDDGYVDGCNNCLSAIWEMK